MAKATYIADAVANIQADALAALLDGGYIDIYDGTRPATADTPISGQTLGVSLQLGTPAFLPAVNGVITANPISPGTVVNSINPATWARVYRADHATVVMDISAGVGSNFNISLPTANLVASVTVTCSGWEHEVVKAAPGY